MKLSKNFDSNEFMDPSTGECAVKMTLVNALQELRDKIGKPIKILSGFRSSEHNKAIGGLSGSRHLTGQAADIYVPGLSLSDLYEAVKSVSAFEKSGIGLYPKENFIHVDVDRAKPARWARIDDKYVSIQKGLELLHTKKVGNA